MVAFFQDALAAASQQAVEAASQALSDVAAQPELSSAARLSVHVHGPLIVIPSISIDRTAALIRLADVIASTSSVMLDDNGEVTRGDKGRRSDRVVVELSNCARGAAPPSRTAPPHRRPAPAAPRRPIHPLTSTRGLRRLLVCRSARARREST
eukprot:5629453-Prymnesium_polylepis.1